MCYQGLHSLLRMTLAAIFFMAATAAVADDSPRHQIMDGVAIYLGAMPAEVIKGHPGMHLDAREHGGVKKSKGRYHLFIALFDAQTGVRITDAQVTASVSEISGIALQSKQLELMHINDAPSYGNYFRMPDAGTYRLRFKIKLPSRKHAVEAEFMFERPRD